MEGEKKMYNNYGAYPASTPFYNPQSFLQKQEVVRVSGRNGAEAYQMAPNSSILLLDETAPIVWLKTTDGASYPTITGYAITPVKTQAAIVEEDHYKALEERIVKLEEALHDKSNVTDAKPTIKTIKQ